MLTRKDCTLDQSIYFGTFTRKFENIQCRTFSVVLLSIFMFFLFRFVIDTIFTVFSSSDYLLISLRTIPYALLIMVIIAFAKIEKQSLNCQVLGLSLQIYEKSKQFVVTFILFLLIFGVGIVALFSFMKLQGLDIHLLNPYPVLLPWIERAALEGELRTLVLLIIPHSICVLLIAPFIEEVYFTGLIFPALQNRLGFVPGLILPAFLFAYHHCSPFSEGQLMAFCIMFVLQVFSFSLYKFTRSLYPSIAFHFLRNMLILSLELSALL